MSGVLRATIVSAFLLLVAFFVEFPGSAAVRADVAPNSFPSPQYGPDWSNMNPTGAPSTNLFNLAMVYDSEADRIVAYGGHDGIDFMSNQTWAYDFESNAWSNTAPETHPNATTLLRAAYDSWAHRTILFGGFIGTIENGTYSDETWAYDYRNNKWTDLRPATHPSARSRQGMAFDAQSGVTILFGGHTIDSEYSDGTWAYDAAANTWTEMTPDVRPPGRRSPGMAYDSKADRVILVGGYDGTNPLNDTWAYDFEANTWTNLTPANVPSARWGVGFAYDSAVDRCILFGGTANDTTTWAYHFANSSWSIIETEHSPPHHAFQGMAYDSESARTIMFGGDKNETWALAMERSPDPPSEPDWLEMNPSDTPPGYANMAMVYDSGADRSIVFGGYDGTDDASNETWAYDVESNTWTNLNPAVHPNATHILRAAYDAGSRQTILFGGWNGTLSDGTYSDETWGYDFESNTWTDLRPETHPSARLRQGMAYDARSGVMILFGGVTIGGQYGSDTWAYDAFENTWTNMAPDVHPRGRESPGMVYDSKADRVILFGGWDPFADMNRPFNDTWAYDFDTNTWTNMSPGSSPRGRSGMGFAYDSGMDRCILFGGITNDGSSDTATWMYDFSNNSWSVLDTEHSPPDHAFQGMAYDSQSARTIMFGGETNQTWALAVSPGPPLAPGAVTILPRNGSLMLEWRAPVDDGLSPVTGYRIYRSTTPGGEALFAELGDVRSWTDTNVTNGETYYYQVSAVNANGEGPRSAEKSGSPDGTAPETSASLFEKPGEGGWFTSPVSVTLAATDDNSGVASTAYRLDGGVWETYAHPVRVADDGVHTVDFHSTDRAGNVEDLRSVAIRIDATGPQAQIELSGTIGDDYWFHSTVDVQITATDATSGVAAIVYRLDHGAWKTYESTGFEVGEGEHAVDAYGVDVAGSTGAIVSRSFGVDTIAPITTAQVEGPAGDGGWYVGIVTVSLVASDALGSTSISYRVDGGVWTTYTGPFTLDAGVHVLEYYAVDASGLQESVQTRTISIDTVAPAATASLPSPPASGWFPAAIPITITASDDRSGIAAILYRIDGGAWEPTDGSILVASEGVHTLAYVAVDGAGNEGAVQWMFLRLDTVGPTITDFAPTTTVTSSWVTLSWTGSDSGSGIDHYDVSVDGIAFASVGSASSTQVRLADGSHTIVVRATDLAGNVASAEFTVTVDTSAFRPSGPYNATPIYTSIVGVIAVALAVAFVVRRRRKRAL